MILLKAFLIAVFLPAIFGLSVVTCWGADGIISKVRVPGTNYCHLKFPAIRKDTLYTNHPVLSHPSEGNIIDFYGPCDHDPLGKEQIRAQREDRSRARRREWGDN